MIFLLMQHVAYYQEKFFELQLIRYRYTHHSILILLLPWRYSKFSRHWRGAKRSFFGLTKMALIAKTKAKFDFFWAIYFLPKWFIWWVECFRIGEIVVGGRIVFWHCWPRGGNFKSVDSATFCIFLTLILREIIDTYFLFLAFHLTNTFGFLVITHVCTEIC